MKVIAVLNDRSGCGKTTLATNLARGLQLKGLEVLIGNLEAQETARNWAAAQDDVEGPSEVEMDHSALQERVQSVGEANDVLVLDGAARAEEMESLAIEAADLVLIPVQPSAHDIWLTERLVERIQARRAATEDPAAAFVISRKMVRTDLANEAQQALGSLDLPVSMDGPPSGISSQRRPPRAARC